MAENDHVRAEHYGMARSRPEGASMLARRIHDHRIACCAACRGAWDQLAGLKTTYLERLEGLVSQPPVAARNAPDDMAAGPEALRAEIEEVAELRRLRRRAKEELWELLRLPDSRRRDLVRRARRRFRSRLLAEMLIHECRSRTASAPAEAAEIADLVPLVLAWADERGGPSWAPPLLVLGAGYRAEALRSMGDLTGAEGAFVALRGRIAERPVGSPAVLGEVAILEARLSVEQARITEAQSLLDRADFLLRFAEAQPETARNHLERGKLMRSLGKADETLRSLDAAATSLLDETNGDLLDLVACRVEALCDLGCFAEARMVIDDHLDHFEASGDVRAGALLRHLDGRIHLGLGRCSQAAESFAAAGEGLLALGMADEAVFAALHEAEAHWKAGNAHDLRRLAARLQALARRHFLTDSTRLALRRLMGAAARNRLTSDLLVQLRAQVAPRTGGVS